MASTSLLYVLLSFALVISCVSLTIGAIAFLQNETSTRIHNVQVSSFTFNGDMILAPNQNIQVNGISSLNNNLTNQGNMIVKGSLLANQFGVSEKVVQNGVVLDSQTASVYTNTMNFVSGSIGLGIQLYVTMPAALVNSVFNVPLDLIFLTGGFNLLSGNSTLLNLQTNSSTHLATFLNLPQGLWSIACSGSLMVNLNPTLFSINVYLIAASASDMISPSLSYGLIAQLDSTTLQAGALHFSLQTTVNLPTTNSLFPARSNLIGIFIQMTALQNIVQSFQVTLSNLKMSAVRLIKS